MPIGARTCAGALLQGPAAGGEDPLILTNAWVVTRDRAFIGTVEVVKEHIVAVYRGSTALPGAIDLNGDYLLPGLVELHTCNLRRHLLPRPGGRSPLLSAVLAHDAEMISAGITTAFGHLKLGEGLDGASEAAIGELVAVIRLADRSGLTRSDHRLGLGVVADSASASGSEPCRPLLRSTPAHCGGGGVCKFPASMALAQAARAACRKIMVAAPSLIGAHDASSPQTRTHASGPALAAENLVDILSSDDYPPSLLQGAFRLHQPPLRMTLSEAIATVSATPAQVAGLADRGEIAPGKRADLIRVHSVEALPVAREVWRAGKRVY